MSEYLKELDDLDFIEQQDAHEIAEIVLTYRSQNASED
jgi:hypothetical protein